MEISIRYKRRSYGTGGNTGKYEFSLSQRQLLVTTPTGELVPNSEFKPAVGISFQFLLSASGLSRDEWSDAEVIGGDITLTRPAAKKLAEALLQFLGNHEAKQGPEKNAVLIEE
jgi:hypothetical protein